MSDPIDNDNYRHSLALLALLEAHQYYANGSDVLARDAITRFLKARKLVKEDGVTWTEDALELTGDNFDKTAGPEKGAVE